MYTLIYLSTNPPPPLPSSLLLLLLLLLFLHRTFTFIASQQSLFITSATMRSSSPVSQQPIKP